VKGLVSVYARVKGTGGAWFVRVEGGEFWLPETRQDSGESCLSLVEEEGLRLDGGGTLPPMALSHVGLFVYRVSGAVRARKGL
jgi:hypothetical protein